MKSVGVIVALPIECGSLAVRLKHKGDTTSLTPDTHVILAGAGPENARRAAETLVKQGVTGLLSWGCCAALQADLRPGDLIIPEAVWADGVTHSLDATERQRWLGRLSPALHPHSGLLAQASGIVAELASKQQLAQQSAAMAVDMESAAIAQVAQTHAIPCVVIRAVADPLDFTMPSCVLDNTDSDGITSIPGLLLNLLRRPQELPDLLALNRHFSAAMTTLKQAVQWNI